MKRTMTHFPQIILWVFLFSNSCKPLDKSGVINENPGLENINFSVEEAENWTSLFLRKTGWFGGDGIFAIPLNGKDNIPAGKETQTMIIFSDSMIGEIVEGEIQEQHMVNNTVAILKGGKPDEHKISFHWAKNEEGKPKSLFTPQTPSASGGDDYWLGDGFLNPQLDSTIYIFAYRMRTMDKTEDWSFKEMGTDLIALPTGSLPPFSNQRQIETPLRFEDGGFGAGIFVNTKEAQAGNPDGYIYVYGVRGTEKKLMVARVLLRDFENFEAWRFWDGSGWNVDMQQVTFLTAGVSNELSVSELPDGRYALIFTINGINPVVGMRLSKTPFGPFGPMIEIWKSNEMEQKNFITYNAKAHSNLSASGEILISYNVNAFDFGSEIQANPNLYRPRFIKLKIEQ
ncbi:MAG: DUF4185 domain-containing protein [Cyclobacteriaceae bacterium]